MFIDEILLPFRQKRDSCTCDATAYWKLEIYTYRSLTSSHKTDACVSLRISTRRPHHTQHQHASAIIAWPAVDQSPYKVVFPYSNIHSNCFFPFRLLFRTATYESREPERYIDPAMIGILVGMAIMFIIICIVLRLFSR